MNGRCDRCLARAEVIYIKDRDELDFCGHHKREFEKSLLAKGWYVRELTHA